MNCAHLIEELDISPKLLDEKKQQTTYKIKYVVEYVERWLLVSASRPQVNTINFIDCMCNAGLYKDGDLCTSMEVLLRFIGFAANHPDKHFNLFVNDYDEHRMASIWKVSDNLLRGINFTNISLHFSKTDVNAFLETTAKHKSLAYGASTILFIDPYDFGTVIVEKIQSFIRSIYCEVVFNFFVSDYVRNGIDARIRNCIGNAEINDKESLIDFIVASLKVGKMQYVFAYQFRTQTNTELYQIIFVTPHIKGLEKLKEALWKTFNGSFYHRNRETAQLSLFSDDDNKSMLLDIHANSAKVLLTEHFAGAQVSYKQIEGFLIEKTMLQSSHFLRSVMKPLIQEGRISKVGIPANANNFKDDEYVIHQKVRT